MHFHQKIHSYLLDYREKYNATFNFLVRQRTDINDKKYPGGKFAHGLVFQGTEKYCFVALSDKSGGANATKSIGIVISPNKENRFKAMLEIVFPGETDLELVAFYKNLASKFEDINWDKKKERAYLHIGEFPENDPTLLYNWLNEFFPIIRETALQTGIEKLIPDDARFNSLQEKLKQKLKEAKQEIQISGDLRIKENRMIPTTDIFSQYQEYLFETRRNEIADSTIESYAEKASLEIPKRWQELYKNSFNTFKLNYFGLKKILPLLEQGFSGYTSFYPFVLDLIKQHQQHVLSKNQILYGPPGTGKTYYLKNKLFDKYTSKQTSITAAQNFENVVSNCSWWQVIAIALLDLGTSKVSTIFEHKWVQKKASLSNSKTIRPTLWGQLQSHTINECEHVNVTSRQQPLLFNKTADSYWEILENEVEELVPELYDLKDSVDNYNPDPDTIIKHYDFVTFHQSFAYEDFIEGIKPVLPESEESVADLGYKIEDGVFKKLCDKAKNDPDNRYAIFIDEINRGNVSAIFGELITLIEIDKRKDAKNEMSIKLPYSKKEFSVPSNIDIYGTMNTADRSVEALDTALRRRFEFKEMMPDYSVLEEKEVEELKFSDVLETINQRIELLIDRDHAIGHSYFINVTSTKELANAFNNKIVPLLQEYFYGDYGKIGLVLGKGFVEKIKNDKIDFANFDYENANDFKIASFNLIKVDENNVIDAVTELLGKKQIYK